MDQNGWEFLVALRTELLSIHDGISDAENGFGWDTTTQNFAIRRQLSQTLWKAVREASQFGVFVVTRHSNCGRLTHNQISDENDYVWADRNGLGVEWQDARFFWSGHQLFQGVREERCPCSDSSDPVEHHLIEDFIYKHDASHSFCEDIAFILTDVREAIQEAGDKRPRSGIRENLLQAVLKLNDAILPVRVEEHITAIRSHSRARSG